MLEDILKTVCELFIIYKKRKIIKINGALRQITEIVLQYDHEDIHVSLVVCNACKINVHQSVKSSNSHKTIKLSDYSNL